MPCTVLQLEPFIGWFDSLTEPEQQKMLVGLHLLQERAWTLPFPWSSKINDSRHTGMRELRVQIGGDPYRALYCFDKERNAVVILGGEKTGEGNRWYEENVPKADKLYDEYLAEAARMEQGKKPKRGGKRR